MINLLKNDERKPTAFLNYAKAVQPNPLTPVGPNTLGENLWPVAVSEDGKRVGFSYIDPRGSA